AQNWSSCGPQPPGLCANGNPLCITPNNPNGLNCTSFGLDTPCSGIGSGSILVKPTGLCSDSGCPQPYLLTIDLGGGNGNISWAWTFTKEFVKGWFTQGLSNQPGSCTEVFLSSVQNSMSSGARSLATNTFKYGGAVASGLANGGAATEEVIGAMA